MDITDKIIGTWFLQLSEASDYLAILAVREGGGCVLEYRFRYYGASRAPDDPFSGEDRKSWYTATTLDSPAEALANTRTIIRKLERGCGRRADELLMQDGDVEAFFRALSAKPWAHMKAVDA